MKESMKDYLEFFNYTQKLVSDSGYSTVNSTGGNLQEENQAPHMRDPTSQLEKTFLGANQATLAECNQISDHRSFEFAKANIARKTQSPISNDYCANESKSATSTNY